MDKSKIIEFRDIIVPHIERPFDGHTLVIVAVKTNLGWKAYQGLTNEYPISDNVLQNVASWGNKLPDDLAFYYFPDLDKEKYNI